MKTKILSLMSVALLTSVVSVASYSPFSYAQSCTQNCANNRVARIYKCETYSTESGRKSCVASAHESYAKCAKYCK